MCDAFFQRKIARNHLSASAAAQNVGKLPDSVPAAFAFDGSGKTGLTHGSELRFKIEASKASVNTVPRI